MWRVISLGWALTGVACVGLNTAPDATVDRAPTGDDGRRDVFSVDTGVDVASDDATSRADADDGAPADRPLDVAPLDAVDVADVADGAPADASVVDAMGADGGPLDAAPSIDVLDAAVVDVADAGATDCCAPTDVPTRPSVLVGGFVASGSAGARLTGGFTWQGAVGASARLEGWLR